MAHRRFVAAISLLVLWTAMPALSCLPTAAMTQSEMACCKKMAGNCTMGSSEHPCCKTLTSAPTQERAINRIAIQVQPCALSAALMSSMPSDPIANSRLTIDPNGLPPPAPPDLNTVLRI
jgi:hypothetical protein